MIVFVGLVTTLCVAMVPPMDMCERCMGQFIDRGGCREWEDAAKHRREFKPYGHFDHACDHWFQSIEGTWESEDCGHRVKDKCGFPPEFDSKGCCERFGYGSGADGTMDQTASSFQDGVHSDDCVDNTLVGGGQVFHRGKDCHEAKGLCNMHMFSAQACDGLNENSPTGPTSQLCTCYSETQAMPDGNCLVYNPEDDPNGDNARASFDSIKDYVCRTPPPELCDMNNFDISGCAGLDHSSSDSWGPANWGPSSDVCKCYTDVVMDDGSCLIFSGNPPETFGSFVDLQNEVCTLQTTISGSEDDANDDDANDEIDANDDANDDN